MKISMIGGGSWGGALSKVLADNSHEVLIYERSQRSVKKINEQQIIRKLAHKVPKSVKADSNLNNVLDFSDTIIIAVPTSAMREVLSEIYNTIDAPKNFICVSKGIEPGTNLRMSEVFEEELKEKMNSYTALTGPSHAEEVIVGMTTCIVASSTDENAAKFTQEIFNNNSYFRVYTSDDLIGAEVGGSLKNVIALASGFSHGINQGDNASAALITRSLLEIIEIGTILGAKKETLLGLTGLGDLIVTATSNHSRNFKAGIQIAEGTKLSDLVYTVEGARTAESAYEIIQKHNLDCPIFTTVYDILYNDLSVEEASKNLFSRKIKSES